MRPANGRWAGTALAIVFLAGATTTATAADPPITVENVRVGFGDQYKIGTWTPVSVDLKAGAQPFRGTMEIVVPDDDGTPTSVFKPVEVPARQTLPFAAYVRPGARDTEYRVVVRDDRDRVVSRAVGQRTYNVLDPYQRLILTVGNARGVDEIPKLPGFTDANRPAQTSVVITAVGPAALPAAWYGYDAAEIVVLDTNSKDVMAALALRGEGLRQWVRNGGHLVLGIGGNWQEVNDSTLKPLLPALPTGRETVSNLGAVEALIGAENKPITAEGTSIQVTKFELVEARGAKALDSTATGPVLVRGHYGFGRVTVVGLDIDARPFSDWSLKNQFWSRILDVRPPTEANSNPQNMAYYQQTVNDVSTLLHSNLEAFKGVKLVPFGWVAFFVFLYILLIGPGDYFFLKKVVKRMELTWITFPLIVATVSLLAYIAAYAVKGTEMRVNKVDAVDIDQADGIVRGSTWFTLFSPQNRDYDIAVAPLALDRAAGPGQPDSPGAEAGTTGEIVTWFGSPERNFGGMGGSSRMNVGGSGYIYAALDRKDGEPNPFGEPESMRGVRVPIWSTKSVAGQWYGGAVTAVDAELQASGPDQLAGTVTNRLQVPLRDAVLIHGKYVYLLGDLAPGASLSLATTKNRVLSGYVDELSGRLPKVQAWDLNNRAVELSRGDLVRVAMFASSTAGKASYLASNQFGDLDMTPHLALDRPILVANLGGLDEKQLVAAATKGEKAENDAKAAAAFPAAEIRLGKLPSPPVIDQTTVVRVILPAPKGRD